jgi:hypothetical protein
MPVILATQEADIRRITVESQAGQTVGVTLSQKKAGRAAQGVGPEFRPHYCKKKKKKKTRQDSITQRKPYFAIE